MSDTPGPKSRLVAWIGVWPVQVASQARDDLIAAVNYMGELERENAALREALEDLIKNGLRLPT